MNALRCAETLHDERKANSLLECKLPQALRQISYPSYELTKTSRLAIYPQPFHSTPKHCSSTNIIMIHPLLPTSLPVSTPNTNHHRRLDLTCCLASLFG